MKTEISLIKLGLTNGLAASHDIYSMINSNRDRLEPWFWWTNNIFTGTMVQSILFILFYITSTKWKKLKHSISASNQYDEQFLIYFNNELSGLMGLDNIDTEKQDAEIWYLISKNIEGRGIASNSLKTLEKYSYNIKNLKSLYAKTASGNIKSEKILKLNNYKMGKIEFRDGTILGGKQNLNLKVWEKQLKGKGK